VRTRYGPALGTIGSLWLLGGCSVTRPVPAAIDGRSLATYLAEHPAANLRVTEHSGKRYWVHSPKIEGDSLTGQRGYEAPIRPTSVHLQDVAELQTGHFSLGRTGAALGGALVAAGVTLAILVKNGGPVY
jgi:hypothetical protein